MDDIVVSDVTRVEVFINTSNGHLGALASIVTVVVEGDHVVIENTLLHDVVEERVETVGGHLWEGETDNTVEVGLSEFKVR